MKVFDVANVNEALNRAVPKMFNEGVTRDSRYGRVREFKDPVCTTYRYPWERVLFSKVRDANPFFHLMESMWILHGRNDVSFLQKFNSRMPEFSDNGYSFHGAYGYRLRYVMNNDQIECAIKMLRDSPESRRVVLQIWSAQLDLDMASKDIPCNDLIFLKIRDDELIMTVCCRSNDMIWGAYGANVVQFSMLQEYIANSLGLRVGSYHQISDSLHVYVLGPGGKIWQRMFQHLEEGNRLAEDIYSSHPSTSMVVSLFKGVANKEHFDDDLELFFTLYDQGRPVNEGHYNTFFFKSVAVPAFRAYWCYRHDRDTFTRKRSIDNAKEVLMSTMARCDWRMAMYNWLQVRANEEDANA